MVLVKPNSVTSASAPITRLPVCQLKPTRPPPPISLPEKLSVIGTLCCWTVKLPSPPSTTVW